MIFTQQKLKGSKESHLKRVFFTRNGASQVCQSPLTRPVIIYAFCLFLSALFLLICTKSSPLYPFNDWTDANTYFTMGKGMINGKILYRDLFDHKGPLIYFLHGLGYLISNRSFFGVFLLEVFSFSVVLYYAHKTASLFIDEKYALVLLPLISAGILNISSFSHGDSAEEFCLPLFSISLYALLHYFSKTYPNLPSNRILVSNGMIAGCIFWIKYSMLGFWIGWILSLAFCVVTQKQYWLSIKIIILFLLGVMIVTIPWVIYFGMNNAIKEWISTYFIINLSIYGKQGTLLSQIGYLFDALIIKTLFNPVVVLMDIGFVTFIFTKKFLKKIYHRFFLLLCIGLLFLSVYGGGRAYIYYFLIFTPLITLGLITLVSLISNIFISTQINKHFSLILFSVIIITWIPTYLFNQNTYFLRVNKNDLVQFRFSTIINETKDATLLNYSTLDMGFYTTTGITPNILFFEEHNLSKLKFPQNMDEQNRYIKEKLIDYVVYAVPVPSIGKEEITPYLLKNYQLITTGIQEYENLKYEYFLYKKIE